MLLAREAQDGDDLGEDVANLGIVTQRQFIVNVSVLKNSLEALEAAGEVDGQLGVA